MDKLTRYADLVKNHINYYVEICRNQPVPGREDLAVFDDERGHYQWLSLGWDKGERAFHVHLYVRLCDGKIYVEEDWTEDGIANELLRQGVPREDIVLAFHAPEVRKYTDFAAA
jgi:hypothetical protein